MAFRFGHFLFLLSTLTCISLSVAFSNVLQVALNQAPQFSAAILRQGHWLEVVDFLEQVPVRKLAFIFLTHNPGHSILLLLALLNGVLVLGWLLQRALFATCSQAELKAARETSLQFLIFRLIFLGSILEFGPAAHEARYGGGDGGNLTAQQTPPAPFVPGANSTREACLWILWFIVIGFIRWFLVLLRERFQTAQASPHATIRTFQKYFAITVVFSTINIVIAATVFALFHRLTSWTILSLLLFENVVMIASCVKIAYKYHLYIRTLRTGVSWEERGSSLYYSDMSCEVVVQALTLVHLVHIWSHFGLSLSVIDLFLFVHVRQLLVGVYRNLRAMRNYAKSIHELDARFPDATEEELRALDDVCSICFDRLEAAKKLPCGHYFHRSCIIQWIEHQSFCPSCRAPLLQRPNANAPANANPPPANANVPPAANVNVLLQPADAPVNVAPVAHHNAAAVPDPSPDAVVWHHGDPASPRSIHDVGLRQRNVHTPRISDAASSSPSHAHSHSHSSPSAHGGAHAHGHGHSHAHAHSHGPGGTVQPIFRFDTSGYRWLPNFSLEVQSVVEGAPAPAVPSSSQTAPAQQPPQPVPWSTYPGEYAQHATMHQPQHTVQTHVVNDRLEDQPPPLEPVSAASISAAAAVASPGASTSSTVPPSPASLRDIMYQAAQRRLGSTIPDDSVAGLAASSEATSSSALPAPTTSSSSSHATDSLELPPLPPQTTSPLLLSQAEADAALARELQAEENALAAEAARNRQGGGISRFFTAL